MSKSPTISTDVYKQFLVGLRIFNPSGLGTEEDIVTAVHVLEGTLDDESIGPIICLSLQPEHPYVFEFILSSIGVDRAKFISEFLLKTFPSTSEGFNTTLGYQVLSRLSDSLSRLPYPSNQQQKHLDDRRSEIEKAPAVLDDLSKLLQGDFFDYAEAEGKASKKNKQRSKSSRSKVTTAAHAEISDRLCQALGYQAPKSRDSAQQLLQSTLDTQKNILEDLLSLTRDPENKKLIRNAYLRENVLQGNLSIPSEQTDLTTISETGAPQSSLATCINTIQADLYFESATGYGKWRILCAGPCLSHLVQDRPQSELVLKRLVELSSGCFSETNQKRLTRDSPIDIYRARIPGSVRLVYHIDIVHEFGKDHETQVLRVLGIYTMDGLKRTDWDKVGRYIARKGGGYVEKCGVRKCCGNFYFDPVTFDTVITPPGAISPDPKSLDRDETEGVDEIHRLIDLEQYAILSQNVIRDILEGHDYPRVFQVSREEKKVIECTRSSFVLGRSGTGKTTVIVFKLFGIERAWQTQGCVGPRPRQLFVTKSRLLAEKVERDYVSLLHSLSAGPDSEALQYVYERIQRWNTRRKKEIFNPDDMEGRRDDLPEKYSELCDDHFPLFVTMDTLYSLLEADLKPVEGSSKSHKSRSQKRNNKWYSRSDLVTFDVFKREYWPHIPRYLTRGITPSLAFSDFLGTIKGSEKSLEYPNRALDREAYENLRSTHALDYALFEVYQKLKLNRGERDLADRTHTLLNKLKENRLKGDLVDFIYVDEVQDMLLIDTRLIISLCRNPDGLLWAGDTAQTISIGSTFSFRQLGASVYRYQRSIRALRGIPRRPEGFQLLVNYRSHGGIVECANAIIQLLQRFPGAIDVLRPEAAVVGKELPKFFHGDRLPQGRDFFLATPGRLSKLGHNQCVIVRDEAARQKFKNEIGHVGITLTLFNSKGLEYEDVILYNFFEESADANLWRHLVDEDHDRLEDLKHVPLIYELKCLYVAITRAKHRLWIVDYSDTCKPIKRCLLGRDLIDEPPITDYPLESFANESTSGEWSDEGNRLLNHREFEEAIMAFDNAGDTYMAAVAAAYQSREVARSIPESETKRRRKAFVKAANAFEHVAGIAQKDEEESSQYAAAARCYAEINFHQDVVRTLTLANMFTEAASYCFDNNLLDSAVSIIKKHEAHVESDTTKRIKQVAQLSYLEAERLEEAAELFKNNEEQMMEFVVEHDLGLTRAVLLVGQEKYGEAVRQYLDEEQDTDALNLALKHIDDVTRDNDAFNAIVRKFLWRYLSFGCRGWPESAVVPADTILTFLGMIPPAGLNDGDQKMLYIFKLILQDVRSPNTQKILSNYVLRCNSLDKAVKLLALDYFFDNMSSALDVSSQFGVVSSLQLLCEYSALVRDAALDKAPWESPWLSTLFQFEKDGESIRIRPGTFLHEYFITKEPSQSSEPAEHPAVSLSREEFVNNLSRLLSERLDFRIRDKDRVVSRLSLFDPCIQLTLYGTCHGFHPSPISHQLDEDWFNRRARFHLQQIVILHNLYAFRLEDDFPARIKSQRRLLSVLENALNPLLHPSGSISTLNEDLIPEAAEGLSTVKRWAFDVLYTLNPSRDELQGDFLTNLYKAFTLGRLRQDGAVDNSLCRIPATSWKQRHPRLIISYPSGKRIYTLYDLLAFMDRSGNLAQGIKFFSFLVRERIPVDLAVLCTIVERLFGLAIMTAKHRGSLHGVLLPQSWILALWKDFITFKDRRLAPLWFLAQTTESLLKDIYTGEYLRRTMEDLRIPGLRDLKNKVKNWSRDLPRKYLQDLCVARICRCFCLLGENFSDLRENVVRTMRSLGTIRLPESTAFHWRYTSSSSWTNLAEVLYGSTPLPFDHLVRLNLEGSPLLGPHPPSVQLATFKEMIAIPNVLRSYSTDHQDYHPSRIDVIIDTEHPGGSSMTTAGHGSATDRIDGMDILNGDECAEGMEEYSAKDAVDAGEGEEPDKTNEALVIQRAARRYLIKRSEGRSNDMLTVGRDRLFRACKTSARVVHPRYRKIYLGPVPHLLLCVEWIAPRARALKNSIKARRTDATLQELSDLIAQQKEMSGILSDSLNLQKHLKPGSDIHPREKLEDEWDATRHLEPLRSAVRKTRDLLERLSDPDAPFKEFELAWNGIMPHRLRESKED